MSGRHFDITYWDDIKHQILQINPDFYNLVEPLSPGKDFPVYIFNFMYGDFIGDNKGAFVPSDDGFFTLGDSQTPREMLCHLGYGAKTSPMGMVLNKSFEWYLSDKQENSSYPVHIDQPGDFFNTPHVTNIRPQKQYLPNGILSVRSGVNSAFILSKIGCAKQHKRLRLMSVTSEPPRNYHEHSNIFRQISHGRSISNWASSIVYFSEKWVSSIQSDHDWASVKDYFVQKTTQSKDYLSYADYYTHIFRTAFDDSNITASLFVQDAAKYIFEILMGEKFGFAPAINDQDLPLELIREAYDNYYQTPHNPIIFTPQKLRVNSEYPVYFSLQHPLFYVYEKNSRGKITKMKEISKLQECLLSYKKLFSRPIKECEGTYLEKVSKEAKFNFYHNTAKDSEWLQVPSEIISLDKRLDGTPNIKRFPSEALFFAGCVGISFNKKT